MRVVGDSVVCFCVACNDVEGLYKCITSLYVLILWLKLCSKNNLLLLGEKK